MTTGRLEIRAVAIEPVHHGAGNAGNTSTLRTQEVVHKGRRVRVPFVSGSSVKNRLRRAAVQFALDVMDVADGSLSKPVVDLLFSGGHLSKGGASVDLTTARRFEELFPALSLCGYSAGNVMTASKVRVSHLHMVCAENAWRVPEDLAGHPSLALRAGAQRTAEFGSRHEILPGGRAARLLPAAEQAARAAKKSAAQKQNKPDKGDSAQMLYTFDCIAAGATLWGSVDFTDLTDLEMAALSSAFHYASAGRHGDALRISVGAKAAVGYGTLAVEVTGGLRVSPAQYEPTTGIVLTSEGDGRASAYTRHLRERKDEILDFLRAATR